VLHERLHRNPLGIRIHEDGKGLHRSVRELALAAGKVVAKLIHVPHHLRTITAEERSLRPPVFAVRPRQRLSALHRKLHSISLSSNSV
jgi:hypothetical protein